MSTQVSPLPVASDARVEHGSFAALYANHESFVRSCARRQRVSASALDDVIQETFIVLYRRLGEYDGQTPIRHWLSGIVSRVVSDHRRRFRRKESTWTALPPEDGLRSTLPAPCAEIEKQEALRVAQELLSTLEAKRREVYVLAEIEELTVPEIARQVGRNVNTVSAQLRAARHDFSTATSRYQARTSRPALAA
jgi:RNA polymerase sigma-70 factor (ECF subfamily)